jgi:DNA excision repair protein ERCC-4
MIELHRDTTDSHAATIHVIMDDRERTGGMVDVFKEARSVEVTIARLSVGDYELNGKFLVERKTLLDFAASIKDGRLFRQACRLKASPLRPFLILEGMAADLSETGMRREALQGALITLSLVLGTPVLRARDTRESVQLMLFAARQAEALATGALPRKVRRPRGKQRVQLEILQGLPGIGPDRAMSLLKAFGSVGQVFNANLDQLLQVHGVGPVTARSIRWAVSEPTTDYRGMNDF